MNDRKEYEVVKMTLLHVEDVVSIHDISFRGFFLTSLGVNFLKAYYISTIREPSSVALVILHANKVIGFATGTVNAKGYNVNLLMINWRRFFLALLTVKHALKATLRLMMNLNKSGGSEIQHGSAELMSIAMDVNFKSSGFGELLLKKFEKEAKDNKCKAVTLTTDAIYNQKVISFYERNGFKILRTFTAYPDRKMLRMIKVLDGY